MASPHSARRARAAHQDVMVEFNERSSEELVAFEFGEFLCECTDRGCFETVRLEHVDYLRIRSIEGGFVLSPGHAGTVPAAVALHVVSGGR